MARNARDVFDRLMALRALLWRTHLEMYLGRGIPRIEVEPQHDKLARWMETANLPLSPREQALIGRPLGAWIEIEVAELVWRYEAAAVLLWALGAVPTIPPYTMVIPAAAVMEQIEHLARRADIPPLRAKEEIDDALTRAEMWHWRARTELLWMRGMQPPLGDSFEATIARAARGAIDDGLIGVADVVDGDFAVDGVAYAKAQQGVKMQLGCVSYERHWALAWIDDEDSEWDTVNPPT